MTVITRFPPSPTGNLHIGGARTALFNYLFAKQNGGSFILRLEDTDKERSSAEFEADILDGLAWLGLKHDNSVIERQSERTEVYKTHLKRLMSEGKAYEAEKSELGDGNVIRFKNPNTSITFTDLIRGDVTFDTTELGDFIIARTIDDPLYHFSVVVDDIDMKVTHIIRGEDHVSNTPRQILILEALGGTRPIYGHLPLVLAEDKAKLSKRKHGETVWLSYYRKLGYLPEAIINFLALLGWNPGTDQEIFSLDELVKTFDLTKVQKGGAVFNVEKLNWVNKEYIKRLSDKELYERLVPFIPADVRGEKVLSALKAVRERLTMLSDCTKLFKEGGELAFVDSLPLYDSQNLIGKDSDATATAEHLEKIIEMLRDISASDFNAETVKTAVWPYADEKGRGAVLWPMRFALTGQQKSPDPFVSAEILGKEETIQRLTDAKNKLVK